MSLELVGRTDHSKEHVSGAERSTGNFHRSSHGHDASASGDREVHVCHVFPTFDPGGAEIRTVNVMNRLPGGFRHTILTLDGRTGCASRVRPGVRYEIFSCVGVNGKRPLPWELGAALRRLGSDVVVTYNWGSSNAAIGACLRGVRPWIQVKDGFGAEESRGQIRRRAWLRRLLYPLASAVVVVSEGLARMARESWRVPATRIHHIPNGIDVSHFAPGAAPGVREALGVAEGDVLIGNVAHLRPEKNGLRLVDAFSEVVRRQPRACLAFVGDLPREDASAAGQSVREMMNRIRSRGIAGRVRFVGSVPDSAPYYRAMDVFALSSDTEQMSLSIMEAMACGLPVVSTDVGDTRVMLSEENRPFVSGLGDDRAYVRALERLVGDAQLRASLGAKNRERAAERFGVGRMVAAYESLYRKLVQSSHAGRSPRARS